MHERMDRGVVAEAAGALGEQRVAAARVECLRREAGTVGRDGVRVLVLIGPDHPRARRDDQVTRLEGKLRIFTWTTERCNSTVAGVLEAAEVLVGIGIVLGIGTLLDRVAVEPAAVA